VLWPGLEAKVMSSGSCPCARRDTLLERLIVHVTGEALSSIKLEAYCLAFVAITARDFLGLQLLDLSQQTGLIKGLHSYQAT